MKKVSVGTLKNGMRFYTQFDPSSNVSGIGARCGSMHDPPGCVGLAHLVEHMLCRESKDFSGLKVDLMMEKYMGGPNGDINVRINRSSTFYGHNTTLYRRHMLECFNMYASLLKEKTTNLEALQLESAAIHQEYYLNGVDMMSDLIDNLVHETMYDKNPARNRIDCIPENLSSVSLPRVAQFIRKYYVPSNMFVVLLGPSFQDSKRMVEKLFDDMPKAEAPKFDYDSSESFPELHAVRSLEVERPGIHQYHLAVGFPTETYLSKDAEAIDILSRILAFRLRGKLREGNRDFNKGVYRALCYTTRTFAHGLIYAWVATTSQEFAKRSEEVMLLECQKLREVLVSDEELDAMKGSLLYSYLDAFIKIPGSLSELIIEAACNGDQDLVHLHSFRSNLKKVTHRRIREVANKYFCLPNYVRVLIKPV